MKTDNERWLSLTEAAEYMGISVDAMQDRIAEIPGAGRTRGGTGHWRVKASAIDSYMEQRRDTYGDDLAK